MEFKSIGIEGVLLPCGEYAYTEDEKILSTKNGIIHIADAWGSHRFIKQVNGQNIAGLQVMHNGKDTPVVANVFTIKEKRLQGYAKELFNHAKKYFGSLKHSMNLSDDGKGFAKQTY